MMQTHEQSEHSRQEHARWESEHGHWLKDLRVWELKHQVIRDAIDGIVEALRTYDETVEKHAQSIQEHQDLLKMHEGAMAWRRELAESDDGLDATDRLERESEAHSDEKEAHESMKVLHELVIQHVVSLANSLRIPV